MKPRVLAAFLVLAVFNPIAVRAQQPAKATIEGVIVNAANGEPVQGARVMISAGSGTARPTVGDMIMAALDSSGPPNIAMLTGGSSNPSVITSADGKFFFSADPGTYRLAVDANGFSPAEFGQRSATGSGTVIHLEAGQKLTSLSVRLIPTGVVTGRIADDAGMPADQVPVQVLRVAYNRFGQRLMEVGAGGVTNDRGEFRLYGITPGRYYLSIGGIPAPFRTGGPGPSPWAASTPAYASSYYPGAMDLSRAVLLDVKPGVELNADMRVTREMRYRVSGRVVDSRTGQPPAAGSISLSYRTPTGGTTGTVKQLDRAAGTFEFVSVLPGTYNLAATLPDENSAARQRAASASIADQLAAEQAIPRGDLAVTVAGNVDNLLVTISAAGVLEGRLTINGEPPSSVPNLERVRLGLRPSDSGGALPLGPSTQVSTDGKFRFESVPAAVYRFGISGLPAGFYVEKAEMNGVDLLSDAMTFSSSSSGTLNVALQRGTGAIRGTVTDAQSRAAAGVEVVLVPEQRRRFDLYKTAFTDKSGRFTIAEVPPGSYRLFSWEGIDPYAYYDPEILNRDEAGGAPALVAPSSNGTVDVRIIPVEP